jgi:hypothetical protein
VEAWAAEYGAPTEEAAAMTAPESPPDLGVETPVGSWAPHRPAPAVGAAETVLFTDGVRRVDARVWIDDEDGRTRLGVCASYAAGIVRSSRAGERNGTVPGVAPAARIESSEVSRGLFTAAATAEPIVTRLATFAVRAAPGDRSDQLALAVQQRMGELEVELASRAGEADLIVIDGPLRGRQRLPNAIGYIKTHQVAYLPPLVEGVVRDLAPGERTPLFLTTTSWSRYSWYLRLPGATGHAWAGVVRGEASADLDPAAAARLADVAAATLPRFASRSHKDPRAPQNLYPVAGLERALRHRLGDAGLLYRSLCAAAGAGAAALGAGAAAV